MKYNEKVYKEGKDNNNMILPGDLSRLPDDFLKIIVFIDNAYLMRVKKHFFNEGLRYNVRNFVETLAKKTKCIVKKIYLYDAPPFQSKKSSIKENEKKKLYDKFISRFKKDNIIVREGRTQRLKINNIFVYKQKGVDIYLGMDLASVPLESDDVKGIALVSGDSDFVPVIEKLKKKGIKTILWTYFERKRDSPFSRCNELIRLVNVCIKLTKEDFKEAEENK